MPLPPYLIYLKYAVSDNSGYVEKLTINLTPFPKRAGGKFKVSLLLGERFRERFFRYRSIVSFNHERACISVRIDEKIDPRER